MVLGHAGRRSLERAAILAVAALLSGRADAQTPSPSPAPDTAAVSPTPVPKRLRLDIDRLVEERFEAWRHAAPRFETMVEVRGTSPQIAIDRLFAAVEFDCAPGGAPPGGGAPTAIEMREARWTVSPSIDFVALAKLIAGALRKHGEDKYFLYRVNAKGDVSYLLREGRLPESLLYARPGTSYELVKAFADPKSGAKAQRRMERGFGTPEASDAPPPAPWQTTTCRPR